MSAGNPYRISFDWPINILSIPNKDLELTLELTSIQKNFIERHFKNQEKILENKKIQEEKIKLEVERHRQIYSTAISQLEII